MTCHDHEGELLAELTSEMPDQLPDPERPSILEGDYKHPERVEITWDAITPMQPFSPWQVVLDETLNRQYIEQVAESLPL